MSVNDFYNSTPEYDDQDDDLMGGYQQTPAVDPSYSPIPPSDDEEPQSARKKIGVFLLLLLVAMVICGLVYYLFQNTTVQKVSESPADGVSTAVESLPAPTAQAPSETAPADSTVTQPTEGTSITQAPLSRIETPTTEGEFTAVGMVIDKYAVLDGQQVQYVFEIRMTNASGGSANVKYFASKSVWDSIETTSMLKVVYTATAEGQIVIVSLEK